jgi:HEPN domain-containing protein
LDGEFQHKEEARALAYFRDALGDLELAEKALEAKLFEGCLFHCQQGIEKGMKAILALFGILISKEHRISDLFGKEVENFGDELKEKFKKLLPRIENLEWYYIPTRYSVSIRGDIHLRAFSENEAIKAYETSSAFLDICFNFIELKIGKKIPKGRKELFEYLKKEYKDVVKSLPDREGS